MLKAMPLLLDSLWRATADCVRPRVIALSLLPLLIMAGLALALGIIGIFLPVMPTTPFILVAAACWARASPRLHRRLLANRHFGPLIRDWEEHRSLPRKVKWVACGLMAVSISTSIVLLHERFWLQVLMASFGVIGALVIWWLPTREALPSSQSSG